MHLEIFNLVGLKLRQTLSSLLFESGHCCTTKLFHQFLLGRNTLFLQELCVDQVHDSFECVLHLVVVEIKVFQLYHRVPLLLILHKLLNILLRVVKPLKQLRHVFSGGLVVLEIEVNASATVLLLVSCQLMVLQI